MNSSIIKIISIIGIIAAIVHMTYFALRPYSPILFFIILGVIYLFVPLTKYLKKI